MKSPYEGKPESKWLSITSKLVARHPLTSELLLTASQSAWKTLRQTTIGKGKTAIAIENLNVPATVIGYFFEVLLARELEIRFPGKWRGSRSKEEKDLFYIPDPSKSVEVKTSGQRGYRIYGNRSYGQKSRNVELVKKEKSGYYLTVNFFGRSLSLLRFGWIDAEDWKPQTAPTGQMAGLSEAVYASKLISISGEYRGDAPVELLNGIGEKSAIELHALGIRTIGELIRYQAELPKKLSRAITKNAAYLKECRHPSE